MKRKMRDRDSHKKTDRQLEREREDNKKTEQKKATHATTARRDLKLRET